MTKMHHCCRCRRHVEVVDVRRKSGSLKSLCTVSACGPGAAGSGAHTFDDVVPGCGEPIAAEDIAELDRRMRAPREERLTAEEHAVPPDMRPLTDEQRAELQRRRAGPLPGLLRDPREEAEARVVMDGWLEDHGGFFCGRCGRSECGHDDVPCKSPLLSSDVCWDVVLQTLEDSLPAPWEQFHFNEPTRRRAVELLRTFAEDRWRAERIRGGQRT